MLTLEDLGVLRDVRREGRPGGRDDHADLLRLPGDGHDARRPGAPAGRRRLRRRAVRVELSPAWSSDWITERGRAALARARHLAARSGAASRGPIPLTLLPIRAGRDLPAVRLGRRRADLGVRRDRVQGAVPLHGLPRAVRARQGDLMTVGVPRPTFHTLTVADVERLTDDAVAVTFDVPDELADEFAFVPGQSLTLRRMVDGVEQRRQYSICAPAGARPRIGVREIPDGLFSRVAGARGAARRPDRGADAERALLPGPGDARGRPAPVHRGRLRHHADAVDRRAPCSRPRRRRDAALRQPDHRLGDVRRGAHRPEEPLRPAAPARARAVPRAP